ncbi:MAG: hypothetical protein IKL11_04615 [Muribaculaceae bacterium]|nr:hypothetical protein [Muribaculaceae bacterium]MBR3766428.1 hypothetical protein [Muribaculaceae bacterium]
MLDESSIFAISIHNDSTAPISGRRQRPLIKGGKNDCIYYTLNKTINI